MSGLKSFRGLESSIGWLKNYSYTPVRPTEVRYLGDLKGCEEVPVSSYIPDDADWEWEYDNEISIVGIDPEEAVVCIKNLNKGDFFVDSVCYDLEDGKLEITFYDYYPQYNQEDKDKYQQY